MAARTLWLALLAGLLGAGCAGPAHHVQHAESPPPELPHTARGHFDIHLGAAVDRAKVGLIVPAAPALDEYRLLSEHDCQCLAAQASSEGQLLSSEEDASKSRRDRCCDRKRCVKKMVRKNAEVEARNRSAAEALEIYYLLLEAEIGREFLDESVRIGDRALADAKLLRERGLDLPVDEGPLARASLDFARRREQLDYDIDRLNRRLRTLLGYDGHELPWRFWPGADLHVVVEPLDAEQEVEYGLEHRAELVAWRRLICELDVDTIDTVRKALATINPLLGDDNRGCLAQQCWVQALGSVIGRPKMQREVEERRKQLKEVLAQREALVASRIRASCRAVESRLRQIAIAQEAVRDAETRLGESRELHAAGRSTSFAVQEAELQTLRTRGELVNRIVAW